MKTPFESFLEQHKGDFPLESPPKGHREIFESQLENTPNRKINFPKWTAVAATLVLLLGLVWVVSNFYQERSNEAFVESFKTEELKENEQKIAEVVALQKREILSNQKQHKELVINTLNEINRLENDYKQMEKDLILSGNEKVINAMEENLRLRTEILSKAKQHLNAKELSDE